MFINGLQAWEEKIVHGVETHRLSDKVLNAMVNKEGHADSLLVNEKNPWLLISLKKMQNSASFCQLLRQNSPKYWLKHFGFLSGFFALTKR